MYQRIRAKADSLQSSPHVSPYSPDLAPKCCTFTLGAKVIPEWRTLVFSEFIGQGILATNGEKWYPRAVFSFRSLVLVRH